MKLRDNIIGLFLVLFSFSLSAQSIIGSGGLCIVDADPNTIVELSNPDPKFDCYQVIDATTRKIWVYNSAASNWQESVGGSATTVENILTSTSVTNALSANQGRVLKVEQDDQGLRITALEASQTSQDAAIALNTAKTGITPAQAAEITANTAKVSADGSVTTHNDVTDAGSGQIITTAERANIHADDDVEGVTGLVDNTDPRNPIVISDNTKVDKPTNIADAGKSLVVNAAGDDVEYVDISGVTHSDSTVVDQDSIVISYRSINGLAYVEISRDTVRFDAATTYRDSTVVFQDSIIQSYRNGVAINQDTVRFPVERYTDISCYNEQIVAEINTLSETPFINAVLNLNASPGGNGFWQSFTLNSDNITQIEFPISNPIITERTIQPELRVYEGNGVGGTLLYTETKDAFVLAGSESDLPQIFTPNLTGLSSGIYTFEVVNVATTGTTGNFRHYVVTGDVYTGGGSSFSTDFDMRFRVSSEAGVEEYTVFTYENNTAYAVKKSDGTITDVSGGVPIDWVECPVNNLESGLAKKGVLSVDSLDGEGIYDVEIGNVTLPASTGSQNRYILTNQIVGGASTTLGNADAANSEGEAAAISNRWLRQGFTPAATGDLESIELYARRNGGPADIVINIYEGADETGTLLATSSTLSFPAATTFFDNDIFTFSPAVTLTQGTQYTIQVEQTNGLSGDYQVTYTTNPAFKFSSDPMRYNDADAGATNRCLLGLLSFAAGNTVLVASDGTDTFTSNGEPLYLIDTDNGYQQIGASSELLVNQVSSRVGEFFFSKSGSSVQGYLPVTPGTVANGAISYPVWAAMYPEFVSGNDIVFPADVDGMFLRNIGGNADVEGTFQDDATAVNGLGTAFLRAFFNPSGPNSTVANGSNGSAPNLTIQITSTDPETRPFNRAYQLYTIVDNYNEKTLAGMVTPTSLAKAVIPVGTDFSNVSANNAYQPIVFGVATYDTDNAWDSANNKYVFPANGDYIITFPISYTNNSASSNDIMTIVARVDGVDTDVKLVHDISDQIGANGGLTATLSGLIPNVIAGQELTIEIFDADDVIVTKAESVLSIIQQPTSTVVMPEALAVEDISTEGLFDNLVAASFENFEFRFNGNPVVADRQFEMRYNDGAGGSKAITGYTYYVKNGIGTGNTADRSITLTDTWTNVWIDNTLELLNAGDVEHLTWNDGVNNYSFKGIVGGLYNNNFIEIKRLGQKSVINIVDTPVNQSTNYEDRGIYREQWGEEANGLFTGSHTVTLPQPMADTNYIIKPTMLASNTGGAFSVSIISRTTNSFTVYKSFTNNTGTTGASEGFTWEVKGLKPQ